MRTAINVLWLVLAGLGLSACGDSDQDDLQRWMVEQRAQVKPTVPAISEPKKFTPQAYTEAAASSPSTS